MTTAQLYAGQTVAPNVLLDEKTQVIVSSEEAPEPLLGEGAEKSNYLVVSPYKEQEHLLDLRTLDEENALLAQALVHLKCLRPDYATAPYTETFDWALVMNELEKMVGQQGYQWKGSSWYIVVFRSQIPPTTTYAELGMLDKAAHAEATASGGFLK